MKGMRIRLVPSPLGPWSAVSSIGLELVVILPEVLGHSVLLLGSGVRKSLFKSLQRRRWHWTPPALGSLVSFYSCPRVPDPVARSTDHDYVSVLSHGNRNPILAPLEAKP